MVVGFNFNLLKFRTEIVRSDWISVETQWCTGSVLEAAGGKLRVAQGPRSRRDSECDSKERTIEKTLESLDA